jgi:hypothetical protein
VLEQRVGGVRVVDSEMLFIIDQHGRIVSQSGSFVPARTIQADTSISPEASLYRAASLCGIALVLPVTAETNDLPARKRTLFRSDEIGPGSEASLVYYPISRHELRLAYQVLIYPSAAGVESYQVIIDAENGNLLRRRSLTYGAGPRARVFTVENPELADREVIGLAGDDQTSPAGWVAAGSTVGNNARVLVNDDLKGGDPVRANGSGEFDFPLEL